MRQHAEIGEEIILATELEGAEKAARLIRHHHENYDGTGYPDKLAGEEISVGARIIAIADGYDATATRRVYHQARPHHEVMDIMQRETGSKYDPDLMAIFRTTIEKSPFKAA